MHKRNAIQVRELCGNWFKATLLCVLIITVLFSPGNVLAEAAMSFTDSGSADEAADGNTSNTAYRIKPLQDKLASLGSAEIDAAADAYGDMGSHWSRNVVGKLSRLDIIAGMDGMFYPGSPVQADQFIKMCILAMGYKIEPGTDYWAQPYIDMALSEGIVEKGELSDYKKPLSREDTARIIVRTALKVDDKPDGKYDNYIIGRVADYVVIADSLKQYVLDGYRLGLIQGSDNKYHPKETLTRAEAAAVVIRFLDDEERVPMKPGSEEVIELVDNLGNPMEIYPGAIREYFEIEKAMEKALPKAKGYAVLFYSPETGAVCVDMYRSYEAWQQNCIENTIAAFHSKNTYNDPHNSFAYTFCVWQKEPYKELFADYVREILKALYGRYANKAIALHDKFLSIKTDKADGGNYYESTRLNDRYTEFIGASNGFSFFVKLKGEK